MDLDKNKEVCGTCGRWKGKRDLGDDEICRVSPSARGMCDRLKKPKPPHGGCDEWNRIEEADHG